MIVATFYESELRLVVTGHSVQDHRVCHAASSVTAMLHLRAPEESRYESGDCDIPLYAEKPDVVEFALSILGLLAEKYPAELELRRVP